MRKIRFVEENPVELLNRLKKVPGKNIWICGGANLAAQLVEEDLIDQYDITIIPIILEQESVSLEKRQRKFRYDWFIQRLIME